MKIALGSAQFGMDYGINNQRGVIPKKEVFTILQKAIDSGINIVDTANDYGSSLKVIGEFIKDNPAHRLLKIVSKDKCCYKKEIAKNIEYTLGVLNIKSLYGFLIHDFDQYKNNPEIWDELLNLKKEGRVKKIGFSLYFPKQLERIIDDDLEFDLIQIPYNLFDRRFEKYLKILKSRGVELHVRSIFMQGLFFRHLDDLDDFFEPIKNNIKEIQRISESYSISISSLCLKFVDKNKFIDTGIIGVDSLDNLLENLKFSEIDLSDRIFEALKKMEVKNEDIIVPSNWPS